MSLKDTIQGAREEAAGNRIISRDKAQDKSDKVSEAPAARPTRTRRSAASSKPSREAAAGVRVVTSTGKVKAKSQMTKEERKAERKREREIEDQRYTLSQAVLKENPEYQQKHKIWFRFLIVGVTLMVIALSLFGLVSQQGGNAPQWLSVASIVSMIAAYAVVIGGMIYDWRKVKPLRDEAARKTNSMSEKRVRMALDKKAAEQAAAEEAKKAAKGKRK